MEPSGDIQPSPSDAHSVDKRRKLNFFGQLQLLQLLVHLVTIKIINI